MPVNGPLDLIIIGGGIGGVTGLHYAKKAGLNVLLLEKQSVAGGLWSQLPAWQDIQINPLDWTLGDIPITGAHQAGIAQNIQAWVDKFDLAPWMRFDSPVTLAKETESGWMVETQRQTYCAKYVLCATGGHNRAFIPPTERASPAVREYHSSALRDPTELRGQRVVVVGGGASAYDLLELCFEHQAQHIAWVYRTLKWMVPTRKPKHVAGDIRGLAKQQMQGLSVEDINRVVNLDLRGRYEKFGLLEILPSGPSGPFDFSRDQLIPGRRGMIENFSQIERHRGEIARISGNTVHFSLGGQSDADVVLWGTGYGLDLGYFDSPPLAAISRVDELVKRCGGLFKSLDARNLFFLAVALESTGSAPWSYAHACRSIVSHIQGKAHLDEVPVAGKVNHFDLAKFLAERDPENYPPDSWFSVYRDIALNHPDGVPMPIP